MALSTLLCCLPGVGCRFADNAFRSAVVQPIQYPSFVHDKLAKKQFRATAMFALEKERALARAERDDYSCDPFSPAHEEGFVDGFVDYLYAGGNGEPPPLPPRRYWNAEYQNPDGRQATVDWFHGFKHGAAVAQMTGLRNLVTVPLSDGIATDTTPYRHGTTPLSTRSAPNDQPQSIPERLPQPTAARSDRSAYPLYLSRLPPVEGRH